MAKIAKLSYYDFFIQAWHIKEPETPLVDNWHIKYLCDRLQREAERIDRREPKFDGKDIIINIPPGSSKSSIVTIFFPVWCWLSYPSFKFISASYNESLAIDHAMKSRDIIRSDWFIARFNDSFTMKPDANNKKEYENDHTGKRIVTSVGGSVTGKHADIIIVDDPIDPLKSATKAAIKKCNKWWTKTMSTRVTNKKVSLRIIVMQRLDEEDLTGYMLKRNPDKYDHICLPGEASKYVNPPHLMENYVDGLFDVNRYDRTVLEEYKSDLGSLGYAGQILQRPAPAEGNLIKRAWFGRFTMSKLEDRSRKKAEPLVWNFTFDGAYTKDDDNDPSAMFAYCMFENEMYVRAVMAVWKEMPELLEWIPEFAKQNGYTTSSRIYIEPKANGLSAAQMLKRQTSLNIIIDKAPTTDKVARVNTSSPYIESKRVNLLEDAVWLEEFIIEVITFPNAKHDDRTDCLTMAVDKFDPRSAVHSIEIM